MCQLSGATTGAAGCCLLPFSHIPSFPPSLPLLIISPHTQEAESLLLRATTLQPDLPKAWKALVDLYEEGEKWKEAIGATEVTREGGREGGRETKQRACTVTYIPFLHCFFLLSST